MAASVPTATYTGELRQDLELIPPGEHGPYAMLFDPVADHYYKLGADGAAALALLDKNYEIDEFHARLQNANIPLSKAELLQLLRFLHSSQLMLPEPGAMAQKAQAHREQKEKSRLNRWAGAYLFFRLPPIHPDRFFVRTLPLLEKIFNPAVRMILAGLAVLGFLLLIRQFHDVRQAFADSLSWSGLVNYFWAILVAKAIHELSHCYTARHYGCRVRSLGISFIVFYPRVFTDLSDSWRLSRRKRLAIDSAGICSELILGGVAALFWSYAAPGPFRSTMFYLFTVSTMGTLLVNANPFIRYDGYYILCDLLNIDNLMQRSNEYIKSVHRKIFLGLGEIPKSPGASPTLLYGFGVCSFAYKLFLNASIILIIYWQFAKPVALLLLLMSCYTMIWLPLFMEYRYVSIHWKQFRGRRKLAFAILLPAMLTVLLIPLPWPLTVPAEVAPAYRLPVSVAEAGFAEITLPEAERQVTAGESILPMNNPLLAFSIHRYQLISVFDRAELEILRSSADSLGLGPVVHERLLSNLLALDELNRRQAGLTVKAGGDGVFIPRVKEIFPGRRLEKGVVIGEIVATENYIHGFVTEQEFRDIQPGDRVIFRLNGSLTAIPGRIESVNPVPVTLKNSALILQYGGVISCYPPTPPGNEFKPVNPLYRVTVKQEGGEGLPGGRTGRLSISRTYSLAGAFWQLVVHALLREFSF